MSFNKFLMYFQAPVLLNWGALWEFIMANDEINAATTGWAWLGHILNWSFVGGFMSGLLANFFYDKLKNRKPKGSGPHMNIQTRGNGYSLTIHDEGQPNLKLIEKIMTSSTDKK